MGLKGKLKELRSAIDDVNKTQESLFLYYKNDRRLPNLIKHLGSGREIHFNKKSLELIGGIAQIVYANRKDLQDKIDLIGVTQTVREAVTECYCAKGFLDDEGFYAEFKAELSTSMESQFQVFVQFFSASTSGLGAPCGVAIGPVKIKSVDNWIDSARLSGKLLGRVETSWKDIVRAALKEGEYPKGQYDLGYDIFNLLRSGDAVLEVKVSGREINQSKKLAEIICKTALDSISLLIGRSESFQQLVLHGERLEPSRVTYLTGRDERLVWAGSKNNAHTIKASSFEIKELLDEYPALVSAFSFVCQGLLEERGSRYLELRQRWATALDWYAEGCREKSDAIAITKIATALDVLSGGGERKGIKNMITNLLLTKDQTDKQKIVDKFVDDIYGEGRSKILHGNYCNRLKSFQSERERARLVARDVLLAAALDLHKYDGPENRTAFQFMGKDGRERD